MTMHREDAYQVLMPFEVTIPLQSVTPDAQGTQIHLRCTKSHTFCVDRAPLPSPCVTLSVPQCACQPQCRNPQN